MPSEGVLQNVKALQVIADFDHTLSRTKNHAGEECCISYGVFEMDALRRSPERAKCFAQLTEKYLPIELSTTMTSEEKAPYMVEWWQKSNDYILETKYTENEIEDLVAKSSIDLRVPKNVHLVSNMMLFDAEGIACRFSEPLIHTFCKNGSMIERCPSLSKEIAGRFNVLLLGDSLGDLHMADGYRPNGDEITVLKIGFLNRAFDTHYEKFLRGFDIVLVDDQTMHLPRHLIHKIAATDAVCRE
uniref:5'-nucleotidase n=1 Tax=Parascaris equorum TaxID=6256 RepID=A0A914RML3_PAREQ